MKKNKKDLLIPNTLGWKIYTAYSARKMRKLNDIEYDLGDFNNRDKTKGCVVLFNHNCTYDHYIATGLFTKENKVNYVMTKRFCFTRWIRALVPIIQVITRDQFKNDTISIRKIKRVIDRAGIICIAPAGQVSIDGDMPYINPVIVKLLKLCKVDVYTIQVRGSYLAYPKWALEKRKFPISAKMVKIIDSETLKTLPSDDLYKTITDSLNIVDRDAQKENHTKIIGKNLARGLEDILYVCPKCHSKYTLKTESDLIICDHCHNTIKYNDEGFLEGVGNDYVLMNNEATWVDYQREILKKHVLNDDFKLTCKTKFYSNPNKEFKLEYLGDGEIVLTNKEFYYEGFKNNKPYRKDFQLSLIFQIPFKPGERFNVPDDEGWFEFHLYDGKKVFEFVQAIDARTALKEEGQNDL